MQPLTLAIITGLILSPLAIGDAYSGRVSNGLLLFPALMSLAVAMSGYAQPLAPITGVVFLVVAVFTYAVTGGGIGGADAKAIPLVGLLLGWPVGLLALGFAFAGHFGWAMMHRDRSSPRFLPFMAVGAVLAPLAWSGIGGPS